MRRLASSRDREREDKERLPVSPFHVWLVLHVPRGVEVFHVLVDEPERACTVRVHPREWDHAQMSMKKHEFRYTRPSVEGGTNILAIHRPHSLNIRKPNGINRSTMFNPSLLRYQATVGVSWSCPRGKRRPNLDLDLEVPIAQDMHGPNMPDVTPMRRGQNLAFFPSVYRIPWPTRSHACISPLPPPLPNSSPFGTSLPSPRSIPRHLTVYDNIGAAFHAVGGQGSHYDRTQACRLVTMACIWMPHGPNARIPSEMSPQTTVIWHPQL